MTSKVIDFVMIHMTHIQYAYLGNLIFSSPDHDQKDHVTYCDQVSFLVVCLS